MAVYTLLNFVNDLDNFPVYKTGKSIRFSDLYKQEGVNVNFVELINTRCRVRTYERGVEDETLSCGTGVTAVVIALHYNNKIDANNLTVETRGGKLEVSFLKRLIVLRVKQKKYLKEK